MYNQVFVIYTEKLPPPQYPYFAIMVGFAWSKHPESYADSGVDIGRVYSAGQVKGYDPE